MSDSQPLQIAVAVVLHERRVLIGQRPSTGVLAGYWEFPGGKILPGESPSQAATRECREETGLEIRVGKWLGEADHEYPHGRIRLHFFAGEPVDPTQSPAAPFQWVPLADLSHYDFPPANQRVIAEIRDGLGWAVAEGSSEST